MSTSKPRPGYVTPFERLCEITRDENGASPLKNDDKLIRCIKLLLRAVNVDEEWYTRQYPDVAEAIREGSLSSARQHFVENGYFEGRRPSAVVVDDAWYGKAYGDVVEAMEFGELSSLQEHFERFGEKEGRFPQEDWELIIKP